MPEQRATPPQPAPMLDIGAATDIGRVREANEDAYLARRAGDARAGQALVAVADGMGGHKAGEVASALAIGAAGQMLEQTDAGTAPDALLKQAMEVANRTIWEAAAEDLAKDGMGTTMVAALLGSDGTAVVANVGDSRAYCVVDRQARLVTIDHTWVNQQVRSGMMSEREARISPFRNLLTRSLGSAPRVEVDLFTDVRLDVGDALVLVSDGVSGYLDERDVSAIVREAANAQAAAERLVSEAVARGGADNATAVVVRRQ